MSLSPDPIQNPYRFSAAILEKRSRSFRNVVVVISFVGLVAPVTALISWSWKPLLGWLLVIPVCGSFFVFDSRAVARWRAALLDGWVAGTVELDALRDGLSAIKLLPAGTVAGMVDPLPTRARLQCFPDPKPLTREALAETVRAIDGVLVLRTAVATVAMTTTLALIVVAAAVGSWWPLAGLPFSIALSLSTWRIGSQPPRHWLRAISSLRDRGLDFETFVELAGRLAWESLPPDTSQKWLLPISEKT